MRAPLHTFFAAAPLAAIALAVALGYLFGKIRIGTFVLGLVAATLQVMMSMFSLAELMDAAKLYQKACMEIVQRRFWTMIEGLGLELSPNPLYDFYYGLIDFEFWARKNIGADAVEYLKKNVHPLDLVFRLAESHGIVALNGGGFDAPDWSLRVSLANLSDDAYEEIGRGIRSIARGYRDAFEASKRSEEIKEKAA